MTEQNQIMLTPLLRKQVAAEQAVAVVVAFVTLFAIALARRNQSGQPLNTRRNTGLGG